MEESMRQTRCKVAGLIALVALLAATAHLRAEPYELSKNDLMDAKDDCQPRRIALRYQAG